MNGLLSVIIPAYNEEEMISRTAKLFLGFWSRRISHMSYYLSMMDQKTEAGSVYKMKSRRIRISGD